ncbi:MerR family transcriptional regulator [bacterium]|nr:MerR family transcriptional regulator [bacterium]
MTAAVPQVSRKKVGKLFYRIQEVSRMTGLKPYVLRYWETEFPELSPAKDHSDQRRYRQSDIDVVLAIRKLLYEDRFTIEGARRKLRDEVRAMRHEEAPKPVAAAHIPKHAAVEKRATSDESMHKLNQSLARLRREVNDLLGMLKG